MHLSLELLLCAQFVWRDSISVRNKDITHLYLVKKQKQKHTSKVKTNYPVDVVFDNLLLFLMQVTIPPHRLSVH